MGQLADQLLVETLPEAFTCALLKLSTCIPACLTRAYLAAKLCSTMAEPAA